MPAPVRLAFYLDDGLICGGAERVARALLHHWAEAGWVTHLISRRGAAADFYAQPAGVARIALMPEPSRPATPAPRKAYWPLPGRSLLRFAVEALLLHRHLKSLSPDVAVAFLTPGNAKLLAAAAGLRCRVIVSERTDLGARTYPFLWRALRRLLYPRADLVTANTPGALAGMAHYVSGERLLLLPNPVNLPADDELALPKASRRIICVGRLIADKRQSLLIEAFSLLGAAGADWHVDILGDGPLRDALAEEIRRRGLQERITLHGNVHDIDRHYRAAAIFVLPSAYEGSPNALLEAMAHGLPSIVSDSVAAAQQLAAAGAGLTFAAGDAADLARQLASLTADAGRRETMGRCARESVAASECATAFTQWDAAIVRLCQTAEATKRP